MTDSTPTITLHAGDNRDSLRRLIDQGVRVHSVVTDPPYGLTSITKRFGKGDAAPALSNGATGVFKRASGGFMGQQWDGSGIERDPEFWKLIHDILLPGGYVLAFSSPRTGHWQACAMEMAGFIMHPFFAWTYGCLDPETECLTRRGWLRYTDITATDEVMQWDSETDTLSWVKPSKVHEYPFDGNMVMIENRHTRQMLTPNHRVYAKVRRHGRHPKPTDYEVLDASTVGARPGNWSVDLPMAGQLRTGLHVDVDYAYLVGWWLTDAWPHRDANACMFSQSKPATLAKLRTALEPHGASEYVKTSKVQTHADEHTFYLTGEMADRLRAEFPTRELGWEVLNWSQVARKALYEGLMDGDGSRKEAQHAEAFWSQKQERRDVFVALALSLGYRAYDYGKKGVVYVNDKTSTTQVQGKHKTRYVPHTGKVWCLTVPTGAFVARRDGRPFVTGNSGFPKAHNASRAIEAQIKLGGATPQAMRKLQMGEDYRPHELAGTPDYGKGRMSRGADTDHDYNDRPELTTPEAQQWEGWAYGAQSMKPALEPVYFGQKPFSEKNGALNLLKHGVGAVNIDGCRVELNGEAPPTGSGKHSEGRERTNEGGAALRGNGGNISTTGRHPANLIHDGSDDTAAQFPNDSARFFNGFPFEADPLFYHSKATKADRAGSKHPTVKPVALMQHFVRLVTPPGGIVLDPFGGSGTTAEAARREGFDCILMEADDQYVSDIRSRFGLPVPADDGFDDLFDTAHDSTDDDFDSIFA